MTTPSETLRAAAARLRECSPFVLIAGRRVAVEPLATELEMHAGVIDLVEKRGDDSRVVVQRAAAMTAFAHSILEEQP